MAADRAQLGEFLRSRRDGLTPAQAGMRAFPGPRRVPGLRREELAMLAGLSVDYYSRVEQGRQASVSVDVLESLARALRLSEVEAAHLRDLADPPRHPGPAVAEVPQRPDPGLLRLMGALDHLPALLLGRRAEVLARNALLPAVLGASMDPGDSFARWILADPAARVRIGNWEDFARATVAGLRREVGHRPHDGRLRALIDELRSGDAEVSGWWDDHGVRDYDSATKRVVHPVAGEMVFDVEVVVAPRLADQHLVVYTVQPDSATARALTLLQAWGREDVPAQPLGG